MKIEPIVSNESKGIKVPEGLTSEDISILFDEFLLTILDDPEMGKTAKILLADEELKGDPTLTQKILTKFDRFLRVKMSDLRG